MVCRAWYVLHGAFSVPAWCLNGNEMNTTVGVCVLCFRIPRGVPERQRMAYARNVGGLCLSILGYSRHTGNAGGLGVAALICICIEYGVIIIALEFV